MNLLKKAGLTVTNLLLLIRLFSQQLVPVNEGSVIRFSIKNLGITVTGTFSGIVGSVQFDPGKPEQSLFTVQVNAVSIHTGITARDNHLTKEDYFDVKKFPFITFLSTKISASGKDGIFIISGNLTIKGTTKNISFPFTTEAQPGGYLFKGSFKINRRDFKVGGSSFVLSDNLEVSLSVYAKTNKT